MMRKKLIAGNWKMNKSPSEAKVLLSEIIPLVKNASVSVMVAPSFVCLPVVAEMAKGTNILVAAQNMGAEESGAFTGEVSVAMLKDLGINAVILGHSERRQYYNEDDQLINKKVKLALAHNFTVLLCIGETLQEREAGHYFAVVDKQITMCLQGVTAEQLLHVVIAYEPVWAIGTGKTASGDQAEEVHAHIRQTLSNLYDKNTAEKVIIQYGGSVNPANVVELMNKPNIDGALVGGASLKADSFTALINYK
jgi:triosephosphate isomerase